jgi:hypothetical protein
LAGLIVLSTDTAHHRYFVNRLAQAGVPPDACLFETAPVRPPFPTGPVFDADQDAYEAARFFADVPESVAGGTLHLVERCGTPQGLALLDALQPDFGVVFGTGRLPPAVITRFRDGLINVHRGISQDYRGLDSDLWAIYHGDYDGLGVTIHGVEATLDTGPIAGQARLRLDRSMRIHQLRYHTTVMAADLVLRALADYRQGRLACRPQERRGRYYSFMPLELKRLVAARFDRHCERLDG